MKLRKKDIGFIAGFALLSAATLGGLTWHYTNWYYVSADERAELAAKEEAVQKEARKQQKEAEKAQKQAEKKEIKEARMEAALLNFRNIYQTQLNDYQASDSFDYGTDEYFIYDINKDGIPELFITSMLPDSTYQKKCQIFTYNKKEGTIKELVLPEECQILNFYNSDSGIILSCLNTTDTISYLNCQLSDGTLSVESAGSFTTDLTSGEWNDQKGSFEDYCEKLISFHDSFEAKHETIPGYSFGDTAPFDLFEADSASADDINPGSEALSSANAIQGADSLSCYEYTGKLFFHPTDAQDTENVFRVGGSLSETVYVPKKEVKKLKTGDKIEIKSDLYTITSIENGIIYFGNDNLCLRDNLDGIENASYYGDIPENCYQMFYLDMTPYHHEIIGTIVLSFHRGAAVSSIAFDDTGASSTLYETVPDFFDTDYNGLLYNSGSYGYLSLENNLVISYQEIPHSSTD